MSEQKTTTTDIDKANSQHSQQIKQPLPPGVG